MDDDNNYVPTRKQDITVSLTMSKHFTIEVGDYGVDEDGNCIYPDSLELNYEVQEQVYLPHNLAAIVKTAFNEDLDLKAAGMPRVLKNAVEDCEDWCLDDYAVTIG